MTRQDANRLIEYTRWANARMLEAAAGLTDEQLNRDLKSSFPSVRDTLVHLLSADWIWLQRWLGSSPSGWPEADGLRTLPQIRERWNALEAERAAFIAGLDDGALERDISYRNIKGDAFRDPLAPLLQHVVNHATYHRGQVTTMLRQLGAKPSSTDYVTWMRETRQA